MSLNFSIKSVARCYAKLTSSWTNCPLTPSLSGGHELAELNKAVGKKGVLEGWFSHASLLAGRIFTVVRNQRFKKKNSQSSRPGAV